MPGAELYKVQSAGDIATPAHLWAMETVNPVDDGSPGGNPGTGSNVTVVPGKIGHALEFNGNNSNVNVGDVAELNSAQKFTITFWMNPDVLDVVDRIYVRISDVQHRLTIETAVDGNMYFVLRNGLNSHGFFDYSTVISADSWHHIAVVFDGSQADNASKLVVYVDGNPVVLAFALAIPATTADMSGIDATIGFTSNTFDGKLDDFRIYGDALTEPQVKEIAGRGVTHYDTIVSAVKDNGTTTVTLTTGTADDRSGEVFISGGNAYAVSAKIDDTHITVIGDASAESGDCTISPYSTIQSALDQLWTDQGSATFTATQIVRIFAGTYDEAAIPNAAFEPDGTNGFLLVIEGDPADSRDNIIIAPTAEVVGIGIDCRSCVVRHLTVTSAVATIGIFCWVSNTWAEVTDCVVTLTASAASTGIFMLFQGYVADCDVSVQSQTVNTRGIYSFGATGILTIKRCTVTGNGGSAVGIKGQSGHIVVESCTVSGFMVGFGDTGSRSPHLIRSCVVYNCGVGVWQTIEDHSILDIVNTIFHTCTEIFTIEDAWPEWSATDVIGSFVRPLNCCFYNYTIFAGQAGLAGTKTFAEFMALNRVEAEGNLDVTDPLFTNPGTGDFSLQTGSPCIKTGHGVGLVLDYLGLAFDPNNPDIGAWSSGVSLGIPETPTITAIVNDGDGTSATASVLTETGSKVVLLSRRINSVEAWTIRGSRSESGDIVATGFTNNAAYESIAISTFGDLVTEDPSLPSIPVTVYITDTAGFFSAIRQALYDWVSGELGIPTIWYQPNAPQPEKTYAAINMGPTQSPRWDYHSPPDDIDGISTLRGDREFGVEIQLQGRRLPNNENEAMTFAEQLTTSLQKGSTVALFNAANFAFVDRVALTDLSALGGTEFEARVSLELLFRMAHEDTDTVGVIETVDPVDATFE